MKRAIGVLAALAALAAAAPAAAQAAPPTGVSGMALDGRVELAWQPEPGATGYRVFRGTSPASVTTPLMPSPIVPPDLSVPASFVDITAANGTTYYYAVRATVSGVESGNSRIVEARPAAATCSGGNPVVQENCRPGTTNWEAGPIEGVGGFATAQSIDHGESVDLKVEAPGGTTVDLEIFRSGYYDGDGARLFSTILDVPVAAQPGCFNDPAVGLYDCSNWSVTHRLTTTTSWPSGVYLIRVTRNDTGIDSHILLVVRDDARSSDVLYGVPMSTYQAYNWWGGKSLYDNKASGPNTVAGTPRAVKVSYDRPFQQVHDTAQFDWYPRSDYPTVAWLEQSGYDVAYSPVDEFERHGDRLEGHRVLISGTHDEYYSSAMRTALEQARERGTDIFFTGANEIYWRVRFEPSPVSGRQDRVMVSYKSTQSGGPDPSGIPTGTWRDPVGANDPENAIAGGMYIGEQTVDYFPLRVSAQEGRDRIWRYTGLDTQPNGTTTSVGTSLVGWEWDARVDNGSEPADVTTLSSSPVVGRILQDAGRTYSTGSAVSNATKYQWPSGALVVGTGTNHWNWGLARNADSEGEPNARIQQATTNILFDMGAFPETPAGDIIIDDPSSPPLVTFRTPAANATNVNVATPVRATFSRPMDGTTISGSSFSLRRPDGTTVPAAVTYDEVSFTATLTPAFDLDLETTYTARFESTVTAANGIAVGQPIAWSFTTRPPDTTPPAVSITSPANGAAVVGGAEVTVDATDDAGVAGVQLELDGEELGPEDTTAPYSHSWDARTVPAGTHRLTAVARDTSGNTTTSAPVDVTVDPTGLVAAYGFEEPSGGSVTDRSGKGNGGTISGAARTPTGRFGAALSFDGANDWVTVPDSASLDLTSAMTLEAWVNPTANGAWRTALMKEQATGLVYGLYSNSGTNRPSVHVYTSSEADTRGPAQVATNTWTHLAATFDGATLRLYVNGTQVSSALIPGSMITSSGALRIGGNAPWGEHFAGRIDEVRVYRRTLSAAEIQADMNAPVQPPDTQPPTAPGGLAATGDVGSVDLTWTAATDNVGVDHYNVHRGSSAGFTPSAGNRVAQVTGTSHTDTAAAGDWYYRVIAEDAAGNTGPASGEAHAVATADTTGPTVSLTAPAGGATLSGMVDVTATAADNVGVAGVQLRVDGADLTAEDTSAPYTHNWNSRSVANGQHTLRAVARDAAGNSTTSAPVVVEVDNAPVDTTGLVGAWGFEEPSGTVATDSSSEANTGAIAGATRSAAGRFGQGLTFDGNDDRVNVPDAPSLDLSTAMTLEAWVNPSEIADWHTVLIKESAAGLAYALYSNEGNARPSAHVHTGSESDTRGTGPLPVDTWSHIAATYDGATLRLYVNGTQVSNRAVAGSLVAASGPLRIGGNAIWGEYFAGLIDEVRVYRRALTAGELQLDMGIPVVSSVLDGTPPSAPTGLAANGAIGQALLSWTAATDNVGVVRYDVHRSRTQGFSPDSANRVAQVTGTSHTDNGLATGDWYYRVIARDAAGNAGPPSNESHATVVADTTAPTVSVTSPAPASTLQGSVNVSATAADDIAMGGVQFKVDGADVGSEDTTAPYSVAWDTYTAGNGSHDLTAVARDAAGNRTTSTTVAVTVDNPPLDLTGLVGAWGFEEGTGTTANDLSTAANDGTLANGASWTDAGRFGAALSLDGVDDTVNVPDADSLDLSDAMTIEAWVRPSQLDGWRTALIKETAGGMEYALYASAWDDHPSGHAFTNIEHAARGTASVPLNEWTHLAATYDGSALRLYVDGAQVASQALSGSIGASTGALRIGGNAIWGEYFKGAIDEVRIYRRALTAAQIGIDMQTPVSADAPPPAGPDQTGQFTAPMDWPLVPVHISMLSNGKVAVWDGFDSAINSERIWDPENLSFTPIPNGRNLFCAAHVTLPDGRLFIAGGHVVSNEGLKDTHIFDPSTQSWFRGTDMARARWYPTATTLPDGRILVISGDNITLGAPNQPVPLTNASETLPEIYDVDNDEWTPLQAAQRRMPLYPFMFVLPDGKVLDAGPDTITRTLDTTTGQWTTVGTSPIDGHSAVMYRPGKILKSGTWADVDWPDRVVDNRSATIDMTEASPSWREVAPMKHPRSYHTLTALADGTVLASGGATASDGIDQSKAVFPTEIWDPETDTWTQTASHQRARLYHSSAVLLPDGRVLLAGGGQFQTATNETNAEVFSPPYLFKGPRPTISDAPATLDYGDTFEVESPDAARIEKVSFVRMGSVTHNFDMDQRFMHLNVRPGSTSTRLSIDAPTNPNAAPPGWYYLILLDDAGVPSKASIVNIPVPAGDEDPPTAPGGVTATAQVDDVEVDWEASTDDTGVTGYRVHRATTAGFTPSEANRIATVTSGTAHTDGGLAPGTYHYRVVAVDAAGNASPASQEASATVAPDSTGPTTSITAPANGATVSGTLAVTADAADDRGVARVQFQLDGADLGAADTSAPYEASWDSRTAPNGPHRLTAVARDAAGNTTTSAPVDVSVDNGTPPTVAITAPTAGTTVSGTTSVTATAGDDGGVASVQFKLDGSDLGAADTSAPYTAAWDTRTAANGSHTLTAVARDTDGLTTTSAGVSVTVDNPLPPPTGLVAAYGFEEPSGASVTDRSPNANAGTITGATRSGSGRFGRALSFDGTNDWVTVPDAAQLDLTTGMTLESWVRPTVTADWRTVLMKERPGGLAYALYSGTNSDRPAVELQAGGKQEVRGTAQLAANTWTHLAATYDGSVLRLYVNGSQVASQPGSGAITTSTGVLRIGGNNVWGEYFAGLIDEVRVYQRALTGAEIQADMNAAVDPAGIDGEPPGAPGDLVATGHVGEVRLNWSAATDNTGVARYNVHRGASAGFTPSAGNRVAQATGTSFDDTGLAGGTYHYRVTAEDAAGNVGPPSGEAQATATTDTTAPTVSLTAPAPGATITGTVDVTAGASDDVGVAGVQMRVDGNDLGAEDTSSPYTVSWNSTSVANGSHTLTAVARDAAGNRTTSAPVAVTVDNPAVDPTGLVAAFGFEEAGGATTVDSSGTGNTGTISGATRSAAGRFGGALSFDGVNDWVTVPDSASLDLTNAMTLETWVRPTAFTAWRTLLFKERTSGLVYGLYSNTSANRPSTEVHTGSIRELIGPAQLPGNAWTHVAATYDGSVLRLYVNGAQVSTLAAAGIITTSTGDLRIGGNNVWPEWFAGLMDEVRVYRRALSAAEIQADMNRAVVPGT